MQNNHPIGVFDSGYGGLTILKELVAELPDYDYLYLGDNARTPYGTRSFETVYEYTLESIQYLFDQGCNLVIVACNTASAKALRSIQQNDLPKMPANRKVLGVIRPTTEMIGEITKSNVVGVLGTNGTVQSDTYVIEINKFFPDIEVYQEACPMWVPIVEHDEIDTPGADYFIKKNLDNLLGQHPNIDTLILACTHYPLLQEKIQTLLPNTINVISQGPIVAHSLKDYLKRHPEVESNCSKGQSQSFLTTDDTKKFDEMGSLFFGQPVRSKHITL